MTTIATNGGATTRHDRAALGVIATYLHELTAHGRPRERDEDAAGNARDSIETVDGELADCLATA